MRKLLMLAASAFAALAFAGVFASAASADEEFWLYTSSAHLELCPAVSVDDAEVSGGCTTPDFEGGFLLGTMAGGSWVTIGDYDSTFDLVLDSAGSGYAVNQTVNLPGSGYQRVPCDQPDGTKLPWAVEAHTPNSWTFFMDITLCIRSASTPPGSMGAQQTITVQVPYWNTIPTELDQGARSANIADAYWASDNGLWLVL